MDHSIARRARGALEPIHGMSYFVPETQRLLTEIGLTSERMCYFAARSAPMGAVGTGTVAATFYNFNPEFVAKHVPHAWSLAGPDEVVSARFRSVDEALRRVLGEDVVSSPDVAEAAELAREATNGCRPEGRPLYAAHADLDWPEEPHVALWHAVSLLREFRGDGHIAALLDAELSGLEALILHTVSGKGFVESFAKSSRGWSDAQWSATAERLRDRNLLDEDGGLTEHGAHVREDVEDETDRLAMGPWKQLGQESTERLIDHGKRLRQLIGQADVFPSSIFATR